MWSAGERINMGMKRCPADGVGRGEFEEPGANHTPRELVISRPNPSGIGQRGRATRGAGRPHGRASPRSKPASEVSALGGANRADAAAQCGGLQPHIPSYENFSRNGWVAVAVKRQQGGTETSW